MGPYNGVVCGVEQDAGDHSNDGENPFDAMDVARRRRWFVRVLLLELGFGALLVRPRAAVDVHNLLGFDDV